MFLKEKHTRISIAVARTFTYTKGMGLWLLVSVFLFPPNQAFASSETYYTENSTIVYSATDSNNVVINEGRITALEGKTIRLLPGTHIKGRELLTVNIASKECQEAVAQEVSKAKEEEMLTSAAKKRDEVIIEEHNAPTTAPFGFCSLPIGNSTINQQRTELVAFLATSSFSFHAPVHYLLRSSDKSIVNNKSQIINHISFLPAYSWGDRAETIKVMRC